MLGNLGSLNQKSGSNQSNSALSRQQVQNQPHYGSQGAKMNKLIKGMISSKTSRVQSRADSRQGNRT